MIAYRTALRFARPVTVGAVGRFLALDISKAIEIAPAESQPSIDEPEPPVEDPRTVENTVESWLQGVSSVHAVRVSALVARLPGTEPVHFAVPASSRGNKRMLQVFFALGARPTTAEFAQLRQCAERASTLPDLDFVSSPRYLRMLDGGRRAAVADR